MRRGLIALVACALIAGGVFVARPLATDAGQAEEQATDAAEAQAPAAEGKPNVLLIVTDDQRKDDLRWTPKTRQLIAGNGVNFRNAVTPNPVCCPTRASLLTGQLSHNSGVLATGSGRYGGFRAYTGSKRSPHNDVGSWMKDAGYRTAFIGKYLNGYTHKTAQRLGTASLGPSGWDFWDAKIRGGVNYTDFTFANHGSPQSFTDDYTTHVSTDRAIRKITEWTSPSSQDERKPFFLSLFYAAPHKHIHGGQHPAKPEPRYLGTVTARNPDERSRAFNRVPRKTRYQYRSRVKASKMRKHFRRRAEALRSVDDGVADIVSTLRERGELENTLIIFTSDNGFSLGQHRWLGKRWPFTVEMRVPLLMRGPGVAQGASTPKWVTPVDITRTIVNAGEASPRRIQDGRSFLRVDGSERPRPRAIPIETGNQRAQRKSDRKWHYRGLWYGRYIYAKNPERRSALYDLHRDRAQLSNRIGWSAYKRIQRRMARKARTLGSCQGARDCYRGYFWMPNPRR